MVGNFHGFKLLSALPHAASFNVVAVRTLSQHEPSYSHRQTYQTRTMSDPPKRGRGRPKGSKNPPGTKNVGRPRKNGEPA
ncbi:hypothetical protein V8E55_008780 [Tylopilus felleus]